MSRLSCIFLIVAIFAMAAIPAFAQVDPLFSHQWALHNTGMQTVPIDIDDLHTKMQAGHSGMDIGWSEAQSQISSFSVNPVTVAIIDYGIDSTHPDLQGRISADGFDFLANTNVLTDDEGHGTHVSGIIAANTGNEIGISGITSPMVKILPLRILNQKFTNFAFNNKLISDYAADAIRYAIAKKASVINLSLGWPQLVDSNNARQAVQAALAAGIVVVAAAGNDLKQQPTYPCAYSGVICVGAVSNTGELSLYSNWGGKVDVLAPGDYIVSTFPQNLESQTLRLPGYEALSGTSQATPMISAMAAILKSHNPQMSPKEVLARILSSTLAPPTYSGIPAAQYGLARLPGLLVDPTQTIYQADFKAMNDILVDEKTLQTSGQLVVNDLMGAAAGVNVTISVNGKPAGSLQVPNLASGGSVSVPWQFQFASLDDSADLQFKVDVTDSSGVHKQFDANLVAARQSLTLANSNVVTLSPAQAKASDWILPNALGRLSAKMGVVSNYGRSNGPPEYFRIKSGTASALTLELFSTGLASPLRQVVVPNVLQLTQVIHFPDHAPNDWEWVITSLGQDQNQKYFFQFDYLDHDLQPFSATPIRRMVSTATSLDNLIPRNYASAGSWVRHANGDLVPSFLDVGILPPLDNFDEFDPRSNAVGLHFYYFENDTGAAPAGGITNLRLRVIDNKDWATQYPGLAIVQPLPQDSSEIVQGAMRFLFGSLSDLTVPVQMMSLWTVGSNPAFHPTNWQRLDSFGDRAVVTPGDLGTDVMAFAAYNDSQHGSLVWTDATGQMRGRSEFAYQAVGDPFVGKILAANVVNESDRTWFLQSHDNLVGFFQSASGQIKQASFPLDRDSSFTDNTFNLLFAAEVVGNLQNPVPGVFVDSTQIVGNRINVVTFDKDKTQMQRSLRYSLNVPTECLNMAPTHLKADPVSFVVPMFCLPSDANANASLQVYLVQP